VRHRGRLGPALRADRPHVPEILGLLFSTNALVWVSIEGGEPSWRFHRSAACLVSAVFPGAKLQNLWYLLIGVFFILIVLFRSEGIMGFLKRQARMKRRSERRCTRDTRPCEAFRGLIAVDRVDFSLEEGELRSLIGPNGRKNDFFQPPHGHLPADEGVILFRGRDITRQPVYARARSG